MYKIKVLVCSSVGDSWEQVKVSAQSAAVLGHLFAAVVFSPWCVSLSFFNASIHLYGEQKRRLHICSHY